jgi:DNA-binding NtrC family response regulator
MINDHCKIEAVPPLWYQRYLNPKYSSVDYPILITGETGTYRRVLAKAIHTNSPNRSLKPFVAINCKNISDYVFLNEKMVDADGGTIFLDEITELSAQLQLSLSSIVDKKAIDSNEILPNVRIITGTKINLKDQVTTGKFEEDLFYRLKVIPINIHPLRKRIKDLLHLVNHVIDFEVSMNKLPPIHIVPEAIQLLREYSWPANLIELQQVIKSAIVTCNNNLITLNDLSSDIKRTLVRKPKHGPLPKLGYETVREALIKFGGNKVKAAKFLGVGRATLYRALSKYSDLDSI